MTVCRTVPGLPLLTLPSTGFCLFTGKPRVELTYDKMYTVTSRLTFTVGREDDGVPVICIVDHPAVKDFQAQKYLEVHCKYCFSHILSETSRAAPPFLKVTSHSFILLTSWIVDTLVFKFTHRWTTRASSSCSSVHLIFPSRQTGGEDHGGIPSRSDQRGREPGTDLSV